MLDHVAARERCGAADRTLTTSRVHDSDFVAVRVCRILLRQAKPARLKKMARDLNRSLLWLVAYVPRYGSLPLQSSFRPRESQAKSGESPLG
jgi:hypothetical protein